MFDIAWTELLIIGIVALVVIGPKELPGVLRSIGQMISKVRRMASEFQGQFNEAMREAELEDLRKQAEKLNLNSNPLEKITNDIQASIDAPVKSEPAAASAPLPTDEIKPADPAPVPATETKPEGRA